MDKLKTPFLKYKRRNYLTFFMKILTVTFSIIVAMIVGEVFLRLQGFQPKPGARSTEVQISGWAKIDDRLGWVNNPGIHASFEDPSVLMNFTQQFTRKDNSINNNTPPIALVLGCSYTAGYSVDDDYVYSSLLNQEAPAYQFINYGTSGYSDYQALIRLEDEIAKDHENKIKLIISGFIDDHLQRNVANGIYSQNMRTHLGGFVVAPHVREQKGKLIELKSRIESDWWLESNSALLHLVHKNLYLANNNPSHQEQINALKYITKKMVEISKRHGAKLVIVGLEYDDKQEEIFNSIPVSFLDCRIPGSKGILSGGVPLSYRVGGVMKHPGKEAHKYWANCIKSNL